MKGNFAALINSDQLTLIDFSAEWCGPCKMLAPILKQVKDEMGEDLKIVKIDVDKNQNLANTYQVRGVPTLIFFKKGNSSGENRAYFKNKNWSSWPNPFL